jgi:hypothetical protein
MISVSDSFVKYLFTRLAGTVAVNWVRKTVSDPTSTLLKLNALNITILQFMQAGSEERVLISLDILGDDERVTLGWTKVVRDALTEYQYTPELDYEATPGTPVSLSRLVAWNGADITFDMVSTGPAVVHVNATFPLTHVRF